jgi:predicted RNA-binding protein with PIN domain
MLTAESPLLMPLLIDGYNLLHVTGLVGRGAGLQGSREALLRFLAATIEPNERSHTTIVFDAAEAPPGLPRLVTHEEMTVHYASDYADADELIEELIAAHHAPRSLLVVSSDHRLQRAAKRRRAPFIDSDQWFAEALRRRERNRRPAPPQAVKPQGKLRAEEIAYWLAEFGANDEVAPISLSERNEPQRKPSEASLDNPFPPGYGEDLLEES